MLIQASEDYIVESRNDHRDEWEAFSLSPLKLWNSHLHALVELCDTCPT